MHDFVEFTEEVVGGVASTNFAHAMLSYHRECSVNYSLRPYPNVMWIKYLQVVNSNGECGSRSCFV